MVLLGRGLDHVVAAELAEDLGGGNALAACEGRATFGKQLLKRRMARLGHGQATRYRAARG